MHVMDESQPPATCLFVAGLIGLGILALRFGDLALVWQPVPAWLPGRTAVACASGVLMLVIGVGLLLVGRGRRMCRRNSDAQFNNQRISPPPYYFGSSIFPVILKFPV